MRTAMAVLNQQGGVGKTNNTPRYMIQLSDLAALAVRNVLHRKDAKFAKI